MSVVCTATIGRDLDVDSISIGDFTQRLSVQSDVDSGDAKAVGNFMLMHTDDGRKRESEVNP